MEQETSVKVAVRIRPLLEHEISQHCATCIDVVPGEPQVAIGSDQFFTFDYVFGVDSNQSEVYDECVANLVDATFDGFNATILAYGQTGSGKTFTMGSSSNLRIREEHQGIIPRVIQYVFENVRQKESEDINCSYRVRIQFLEIYGEEIRDLLDPSNSNKVSIREHPTGEVYVAGAREELVTSAEEMMMALERGSMSRTTGSTLMNQSSSRSHAIFTILLENTIRTNISELASDREGAASGAPGDAPDSVDIIDGDSANNDDAPRRSINSYKSMVAGTTEIHTCKFHFVDLAGSERAKRTGAEGTRLREGIDINKGLLVLGNVISALGDDKKRGKSHVPYRDSKLTRMLQDSLGGNSKTVMICCVSPADTNLNESLNALRYANRARNIKNKPVINRDPTSVVISELKAQVKVLATELLAVHKWIPSLPNSVIQFPFQTPVELLEEFALSSTSNFITFTSSGAGNDSYGSGSNALKRLSVGEHQGNLPKYSTNNNNGISNNSNSSNDNNNNNTSSKSLPRNNLLTNEKSKLTKDERADLSQLRMRLSDSDAEIQRLTEEMRKLRSQIDQVTEQSIIDRSERDFYRMKWSDADPEGSRALQPFIEGAVKGEIQSEQTAVARTMSQYIREIAQLKKELADTKRSLTDSNNSLKKQFGYLKRTASTNGLFSATGDQPLEEMDDDCDSIAALLEGELTSSVTKVIARTQEQLKEEQRRLRELDRDTARETGTGSTSGDLSDDNDEDALAAGKELEDADREFQRRQKMMTAEVVDLNESIQLKQQLVQHLKSSTVQYTAMKAFYETKLQALSQEMQEKEEEMSKLQHELQDLANKAKTGPPTAPGVEAKLREKLLLKEEELRALKSRQQELSHLSKVQSRHIEQISKLSNEIENMKKQKVNLSRQMQQEKKSHMQALAMKAREIEKLKRDLLQSTAELQRRDRERADSRFRGETMTVTTNPTSNSNFSRRTQPQYQPRYMSRTDASTAVKRAHRALRSTPKPNGSRLLTEGELKTKRWIEQRIVEIAVKEELADSLRKHCSEQVTLSRQRDALVADKKKLSAIIDSGDGSPPQLSELYELEDQIAVMETQLAARGSHISDMQATLGVAPGEEIQTAGAAVIADALESLRQSAVNSASAAQDLLRLTFELLVTNRRRLEQSNEAYDQTQAKLKAKEEEIEDLKANLAAAQRLHDRDLTKAVQEYEEKLTGLFENSNVVQMMHGGENQRRNSQRSAPFSDINDMVAAAASASPIIHRNSIHLNHQRNVPGSLDDLGDRERYDGLVALGMNGASADTGMDQFKMMLSLSTERNSLLKAQLNKEVMKTQELQERLSEMRSAHFDMKKNSNECQRTIKFLEEECRMLREMADEFKSRLKQCGGEIGLSIIRQVKQAELLLRGDSAVDDDEDDDTQSVLGEFSSLADEIQRTGVVAAASTHSNSSSSQNQQSASSSSKRSGQVFDRLANPSSYTGTSKNLFLQDLETKRAKVLQIKREEAENRRGRSASSSRLSSVSPTSIQSFLPPPPPITPDLSPTLEVDEDIQIMRSGSDKSLLGSVKDRGSRRISSLKTPKSGNNFDTSVLPSRASGNFDRRVDEDVSPAGNRKLSLSIETREVIDRAVDENGFEEEEVV